MGVFGGGIERWTGFRGEVGMGVDCCVRVLVFQLSEKTDEGFFLLRCSCVFWCEPTIVRHATYVANAYGKRIVTSAMCAYVGKWATFFDGAVKSYYEVISAGGETTLTVPAVNVFECVCSALGCGRAMDYYFAYVHI